MGLIFSCQDTPMKLLLLSSSRVDDTEYLAHAAPLIKQHLGSEIQSVLFIPFAGVSITDSQYTEMASNAFSNMGYSIDSLDANDPVSSVINASAIAVGGGNTFALLHRLYQSELLEAIKSKVVSGIPYIGWSAGSNITAPTICTTNDMPIIEPPKFDALNLVPFQINPHYIDGNPPGHNGETREQRITEYLGLNPDKMVIGLPEGTALKLIDDQLSFVGDRDGFMFQSNQGKSRIIPNTNLSHIL